MPYTYPPAPATLSGDNITISRFLTNPTLVARRLRTIAEQRFISDTLLTGRFTAQGGAILYETGETIYTDRSPEAVAPGSNYPQSPVSEGTASLAKTVKWGEDVPVTDEAIARRQMDPVNRAFLKLVNQMVKYVDGVAMSAIASAVTATASATASWKADTGTNIFRDIMLAKANILALNQGYDPDTVVVDDITYANMLSDNRFQGLLPREQTGGTVVYSGQFPQVAGLRILPSPNITGAGTSGAKALVLDSKVLGGMADENLGGPGYVSTDGVGVQAKSIRKEETDSWLLRCRRITVPVILEPAAAQWITGVEA
jgi:hypothetical protein